MDKHRAIKTSEFCVGKIENMSVRSVIIMIKMIKRNPHAIKTGHKMH